MGIKINKIYQTNIILNDISITYYILLRISLPHVRPVPLASNLIRIPKLRQFLIRGQQSSLFEHHRSRTSYHSNTTWVPYQSRLSHKITSRFLTVSQLYSQQSAWPLNQPAFQRLHSVWKIMTRYSCSIFCVL